MRHDSFCIELDGRRVLINQYAQEVCVLDAAGNPGSPEHIQVAAGSVQGIFSALEDAANPVGGISRRDA